jgi:hypothetical protein
MPLVASLEDPTSCNPNCEACGDVHDIGTITCTAVGPCTTTADPDAIPEGAEDTLLDYLLGEEAITDISADMCRLKCEEQATSETDVMTKKCQFFHWIEAHEGLPTTCSLQTTCPPDGYCDESKHCVSGELGCNEDCLKIKPCALSKSTWTHDLFHVICTDKEIGDVSIYIEDTIEVNDGTVCSTVRKCSEWDANPGKPYNRKLAVYCEGTEIADGHGTWMMMLETGSDEFSTNMLPDITGKITEQNCTASCDDLDLSNNPDQYWADLICETPLENHVLKDPNSCILLCDNHLKTTIDCKYNSEGEKHWYDGEDGIISDANQIKC